MQKIILSSIKLVVVILVIAAITTQAQALTRTASVTGDWSNTATWGGNPVPTALDDVIINNNVTVTVDVAAACLSLTINGGTLPSTVTLSGTNSLTVTSSILINAGTGTNAHKTVDVGSGTLSCTNITLITTGNNNRTTRLLIGTGTVNVSGNIVMGANSVRSHITFSGAGTLNLDGSITGGDIVQATTTTGSTVNFKGSSPQTGILGGGTYQYYNLHFNNSATATLDVSITTSRVLGNVSVQSGILSTGATTNGIVGNSGMKFELKTGATLELTGAGTPTIFLSGFSPVTLDAGSTVDYIGANQTIADIASPGYGNLSLSGTGTKTAQAGLDIQSDLTLNTGITFAAMAYTHNLKGTWYNNEATVTGNNTINFNGTIDQAIDGGASTQTFYNIVVNNSTGVSSNCGLVTINNTLTISNTPGKFIVPAGNFLTVNGSISNTAGVSGLILQCDPGGNASLIHPNSGVDATVERYIVAAEWSGWNFGWHFLSSPVTAQPINGTWTPSGDYNDYDFYAWDEPTATWVNFKNTATAPFFSVINPGTNFVVGRGYNVAYEQDDTKEFKGALNASNVTKSGLTMSSLYYSWNLLGNPYPCALQWLTGWTTSNVGGVCQVWSDASLDYVALSEGEIIPAMNGFMVEATSTGASLTIPTSARIHDDTYTPWYKNTLTANTVKLTAWAEDRKTAKQSSILLNPASTVGFDNQFDGHYLGGFGPKFYSLAGDDQLSVNSLPELNSNVTVPFAFTKNTASNFTIEMDTKDMIPDLTVYLTDNKTGIKTNLTQNPVYSFSSVEGDDINRFVLNFVSSTGINPETANDAVEVYVSNNKLYINQSTMQSGKINLFSLSGQMISTYNLEASLSQSLSLPTLAPGVYLVNIRTNLGTYTRKVMIK